MSLSAQDNSKPKYIVVIGTSAGGLDALTELVSQIDPDIDAAFFIVMHLSGTGISDFLLHRLRPQTSLICEVPRAEQHIKKGHIYIAAHNYHLLLKDGHVMLGHGPQENRWRPSIDVLFRSAAAAYDGRVIGVILTGLLDDGASGMLTIKRCGGRAIVQDPNEAEYPDMPLAVLNTVKVDACVSLSEMGETINRFASETVLREIPIPEDVKRENEISEKVVIGIDAVSDLGEQTIYNCPDCGGSLWKVNGGGVEHYRCHIGHSYSQQDLLLKQSDSIESTIWVAIRIMEERRKLLKQMEDGMKEKGFKRISFEHKQKREELDAHIDRLKELLFAVQRTDQRDSIEGPN